MKSKKTKSLEIVEFKLTYQRQIRNKVILIYQTLIIKVCN